ncbi:hypothetical protein QEZ40_003184 [Streptomyces katrae]|uniref:ATP-binding protein n=1 Tax=Streptomyces katrae TaxID=68223 RepID=A0ABT7GXC1_9ACTN|nr:hypothetical protein [Streptomyces katrae]MDK9498234.1 hypothetical protein [Streptomyces katrae]
MTTPPPYDAEAAVLRLVPAPRGEAVRHEEPRGKRESQPPQVEVLRHIGQNDFRYVRSSGDPYAVCLDGPAVAVPLRAKAHSGSGSLREHLMRTYLATFQRTPSQTALTDAVSALDALSYDAPETDLWLRVAPDPYADDVTWLDLGRPDGQSVRIAPDGWTVTSPDPAEGPIWRRSKLIRPLPLPVRASGGWRAGMEAFAEILPFTEATLPLAVAWVLAALRPSLPRPIAYLTGEQGTGKSTSGKMLIGLLDGANAPLRQAPENLKDLGVTTAAGWTLALDNLSTMPGWLSDALCRVVTGDALVSRALYSDDDVSVLSYQRPVLLTGIDVGAVRNDLAERMLPLELAPITRRRTTADLWGKYQQAHPEILGAVLDLAVAVWADLPAASRDLAHRPRMADFAELLHALDRVTGWQGLRTFYGTQDVLVDSVLEGQPVTAALRDWVDSASFPPDGWTGTMTDLNNALLNVSSSAQYGIREGWPRTPAALSARLKATAPALRARGIHISPPTSNKNGRKYTITRVAPD